MVLQSWVLRICTGLNMTRTGSGGRLWRHGNESSAYIKGGSILSEYITQYSVGWLVVYFTY
jgi:hypothetical protein